MSAAVGLGGTTSSATGGGSGSHDGTAFGSGGAVGSGAGEASMGGALATGGVAQALTCAQAAEAYSLSATPLGGALTPGSAPGGFGAENFSELPVAVDPTTGKPYVGLTTVDGIATIATAEGIVASTPDATLAGIAVTDDGVAALLFDPNDNVEERTWAAVARYARDGSVLFQSDLFRSSNLDDVGTKGGPSTGRLGYLAGSDELIAYFAHTQRYEDGVRHQGGYLATVDASGAQQLVSGWWGSHNLDQRLLASSREPALLGLGDAYPQGVFFAFLGDDPRTNVIYPLASAGNGSTNGQLGGMVELGARVLLPFITNRSIPQDLDAGAWPALDEAISAQIAEAADNGTDLGLLDVPHGATPGELAARWLEPELSEGASLAQLKAARYGTGELVLIAWAEVVSSGWSRSVSGYYTMVIDREGTVCQPRRALERSLAFTSGDDLVGRADGSIVWANQSSGAAQIVTLTPR